MKLIINGIKKFYTPQVKPDGTLPAGFVDKRISAPLIALLLLIIALIYNSPMMVFCYALAGICTLVFLIEIIIFLWQQKKM